MRTRREGFANQRLVVLPEAIVSAALQHPLLRGFLLVAAGHFPTARGHRVKRAKPLPDGIVILCVAGRGWVRVGKGKALRVEAPALVHIPAGEAHEYGADESVPWIIYWAHLRGSQVKYIGQLFGFTLERPVIPLPPSQVDFAEACDRLEEDYSSENLLAAAALLWAALIELHRLRTRQPGSEMPDPVGKTIRWMRKNPGERVALPWLARRAGLSVSHYSILFRTQTGFSPMDYFLRMKIQHACRLLDTSSLRVEEVGAAVGFEDPFYFSRLFRRIMGQSPRAYRALPKG